MIAANASDGAYFSQSWGWVALAFLVPTTVLSDPRSRRWLRGGCGSRSSRSWGAPRTVDRAVGDLVDQLVGVRARGRADARVRRRRVRGSARPSARRRAGSSRGRVGRDHVVRRRTGSPRGSSRIGSTRSTLINTYRLAEPLGYWNALRPALRRWGAILAVGLVAHAPTCDALVARRRVPLFVVALYFVLARFLAGALRSGSWRGRSRSARLRFLWSLVAVARPSASRRGRRVASGRADDTRPAAADSRAQDIASPGVLVARSSCRLSWRVGAHRSRERCRCRRGPSGRDRRRHLGLSGVRSPSPWRRTVGGGPRSRASSDRFEATQRSASTSTIACSAISGTVGRTRSGSPGTRAWSTRWPGPAQDVRDTWYEHRPSR